MVLITIILFLQVIQAVLRHVNFEVVKAVIIASPGFVRQQFFDYMYQQVGGGGWVEENVDLLMFGVAGSQDRQQAPV